MMLRRLAALAALPVLALSLAAAPAMAANPAPLPLPPRPSPEYVWVCVDPADVSVDLGGLLGLHIDLDHLLHPWHGHYCGWVPAR